LLEILKIVREIRFILVIIAIEAFLAGSAAFHEYGWKLLFGF